MRRFAPLLVVLLGAWLRFHALVQDIRFQPDEAWFSTFARAAALNGDWWLRGPLDKPPLAIYANALAQVFIGDSEFAARVPGTFAGILLLPVMFAAAQAWYGAPRRVPLSLTVLILAALSPYAIAFSATAYTDTPMLLGLGLALALAGRSQWGWSGVWLGLAFACKQQALFYLPLLLMLGWSAGELTVRRTLRFLAGLLAVTL
ncbi:MAG TPA: glycosyltransferase family 39 protein, partial [Spirillospora sp.]|nr:glycosyltransferase family 39 protein [Spirillospora sp.]